MILEPVTIRRLLEIGLRPCLRKVQYPSKKVAKKAADRNMQARGGRKLYIYRCQNCRKWHLSNLEQPK